MITISAKELRHNFQSFVDKLNNGESFLLLYKSKAVAEIIPPKNLKSFSDLLEEELEKATLEDVGEDYLSEEELSYYLSLK